MATLQGLDRGLRALDIISLNVEGVTVAELASRLGIDRAIAYRIVETLEEHALVTRSQEKRVRLGAGAVVIAGRFQPQLVRAAEPVLQELADLSGLSAFLSVAQGEEECMPVLVAEPSRQRVIRVGYRVGMRHPLTQGAAGIAILAAGPPRAGEPEAVGKARGAGYSVTSGELEPGAIGIAAGFAVPGLLGASVGVVTTSHLDAESIGAQVREAAARLGSLSQA